MVRRHFIMELAGAAFSILPSRTLGRAGTVAPGSRIGMGFIGLGGQGTGHLLGGAWTYVPGGYASRDDVQVLAVCDVRRDRRDAARERCNQIYASKFGVGAYDSVEAYNDFREVIARPDIDAVLLALPYHWAAKMATLAAKAGKDVYCEKPVCITVREGRVLSDTVRRHGRIYQAGTQQRSEYGGKFSMVRDLVRNGCIGDLKHVYAYRPPGAFYPIAGPIGQPQAVPQGFDWDLWLGPLPRQPYCGSAGHALPGNFVGDVNWSPHHYDFIQWVLAADRGGPTSAEWEPSSGADNGIGIVHYHYPGGVVVHSMPYPGEPIGEVGGACFVGTKGRIAVDREGIRVSPAGLWDLSRLARGWRRSPPQSHANNFIEGVRSRRNPICDAETAHRSMSAILVGGIAIALRRSVVWDPADESFVGDAEANRLLSYACRVPYT